MVLYQNCNPESEEKSSETYQTLPTLQVPVAACRKKIDYNRFNIICINIKDKSKDNCKDKPKNDSEMPEKVKVKFDNDM